MGFSINLRSDLAKLSDADLAKRLEETWHSYEEANKQGLWRGWYFWMPLIYSFRGPLRHPRAYRFLAALQGSSGSSGWLDLLFAVALSDKRAERFLKSAGGPIVQTHMSLCEIRGIIEEVERRVEQRQGQAR